MKLDQYRAFTNELSERLKNDPRAIGLVALGSMAERDTMPDEFSDHDFFVITHPGAQEPMRTDLRWLPRPQGIAFHFRETAHGVRVIYEDGHLLEFAVFDLTELQLARVNWYRVLFDRDNIEQAITDLSVKSAQEAAGSHPDANWLFSQFLANVLVAGGRWMRGERLSARAVLQGGVRNLIEFIWITSSRSEPSGVNDDLDPLRRFEMAFPDMAKVINESLASDVVKAGVKLVSFASAELDLNNELARGCDTVMRKLQSWNGPA